MKADAYKLGGLDAGIGYGLSKVSGFWDHPIVRKVTDPIGTKVVEPLVGFVANRVMNSATGGGWDEARARMRDPALDAQTAEKLVSIAAKPIQAVGNAIGDTVSGRNAFPLAEHPAEAMRQFREALQAQGLTKKGALKKEAFVPALKAAPVILGGLAGAALAPEDERAQGAVLGGLGALGLQSSFSRGRPAQAPHVAPVTAGPSIGGHSLSDIGNAMVAEGKQTAKNWLNAKPTKKEKPPGWAQQPLAASAMPATPSWPQTQERQQNFAEQAARLKRRTYVPPAKVTEQSKMDDALRDAFQAQGISKAATLEQFKLALDVGGSIPIPGMGGLGVSFKDQRERLPGMSRWVPRGAVERGFDYADEGFDPETVMDLEADRGSLVHPASGAALAMAAAAKFAPKSGVGGALVSGLLGAGGGSLYHRATADGRRREGLEALEGAQRERYKFPIRRHPSQTANEASPLAVSRGHGDA